MIRSISSDGVDAPIHEGLRDGEVVNRPDPYFNLLVVELSNRFRSNHAVMEVQYFHIQCFSFSNKPVEPLCIGQGFRVFAAEPGHWNIGCATAERFYGVLIERNDPWRCVDIRFSDLLNNGLLNSLLFNFNNG